MENKSAIICPTCNGARGTCEVGAMSYRRCEECKGVGSIYPVEEELDKKRGRPKRDAPSCAHSEQI